MKVSIRGPAIGLSVALLTVAVAVVGGAVPVQASGVDGPSVSAPGCVKPTIVLVHGAWADASSWSGEVERLQQAGYVARAVTNPLRGLTGDSASIADFLGTLDGPIVLVGHSYGGSVITNAAAGNRNVKQLVYVDAAAPAVGETTGQLSGKTSALAADPGKLYDRVPYPGAPTGETELVLKEPVFLQSFGPDLPPPRAKALWASQRPASTSAFMTPSAAAAWTAIPSWYVIGTADKIITPESQTAMANRAHSKIKTVPGGSHLTLISHPGPVTDQILAAVHAVCPSS